MIISHNMMALNAMRQYNIVTKSKSKNTEKLSSGYKINRAADDAAGLSISEKMRKQIRGLTQASANVQDGISFVQVAEGALNEVDDMLHRINELAVKAANGTLSDNDRGYIDEEIRSIKAEMDRIFDTTSFNERKIWRTEVIDEVISGYEKKQALTVNRSYAYFDVTNENSGVIPQDSYIYVLADTTGLSFKWTGYNGTTYNTDKISWDNYKNNNYSVQVKDLYNDPGLFDGNGDPLINFTYSISPVKEATTADIINTINNSGIYVRHYAPVSIRFEDSAGNVTTPAIINGVGASLTFKSAYDSQMNGATSPYSFDNGVDGVIEPSSTSGNMTSLPVYSTVEAAKSDTNKFEFTFKMDGVGTVKSECNSISYKSYDSSPEAENIWWHTYTYPDGRKTTYVNSYSTSANLAGIMKALTDSDKPGLLSAAEGGCSKNGGYISMYFDMQAGGTNIGSMTIDLRINSDDTEKKVLDKIKAAFNSSTVLDLYTTDSQEQSDYDAYAVPDSARTNKIDVPIYKSIYKATNNLLIKAGADSGQYIDIEYVSLSTERLGLDKTTVNTIENATRAISEVDRALQIVNQQRSDFGAYQNRMEHTIDNLNNVVENTTAAESRIRDTDMAKAMVQQSIMNILEQAGTSMLTQANQSVQGVMSLLE